MADRRPITLRERNDETLLLTITGCNAGDDLTSVVTLEVFLKPAACDADATGLILTSANPAEVEILTHTATQITAVVHIPASALETTYDQVWRVDGIGAGGARRTAMYGPVTVVAL